MSSSTFRTPPPGQAIKPVNSFAALENSSKPQSSSSLSQLAIAAGITTCHFSWNYAGHALNWIRTPLASTAITSVLGASPFGAYQLASTTAAVASTVFTEVCSCTTAVALCRQVSLVCTNSGTSYGQALGAISFLAGLGLVGYGSVKMVHQCLQFQKGEFSREEQKHLNSLKNLFEKLHKQFPSILSQAPTSLPRSLFNKQIPDIQLSLMNIAQHWLWKSVAGNIDFSAIQVKDLTHHQAAELALQIINFANHIPGLPQKDKAIVPPHLVRQASQQVAISILSSGPTAIPSSSVDEGNIPKSDHTFLDTASASAQLVYRLFSVSQKDTIENYVADAGNQVLQIIKEQRPMFMSRLTDFIMTRLLTFLDKDVFITSKNLSFLNPTSSSRALLIMALYNLCLNGTDIALDRFSHGKLVRNHPFFQTLTSLFLIACRSYFLGRIFVNSLKALKSEEALSDANLKDTVLSKDDFNERLLKGVLTQAEELIPSFKQCVSSWPRLVNSSIASFLDPDELGELLLSTSFFIFTSGSLHAFNDDNLLGPLFKLPYLNQLIKENSQRQISLAACVYLVTYPFARYLINNIKEKDENKSDFTKLKILGQKTIKTLNLAPAFHKAQQNLLINIKREDPTEPLLKAALATSTIWLIRKAPVFSRLIQSLRYTHIGKLVDLGVLLSPSFYFGYKYLEQLISDPE